MPIEYEQYEFEIDVFTPTTFPMSRLAEYMKDLSLIFGFEHAVHFLRVDEGSVKFVIAVQASLVPQVQKRLAGVRDKTGPVSALRTYESLEKKLQSDNANASLRGPRGIAVEFEGRDRPKEQAIPAVSEQGYLEGELVQIGGRDDSISIHLRDGEREYIGGASRSQGRELAQHLFTPVRVFGTGFWGRDDKGVWSLKRFDVNGFQPLTAEPLTETVARLRALPRPDIDPVALLAGLTNGESSA